MSLPDEEEPEESAEVEAPKPKKKKKAKKSRESRSSKRQKPVREVKNVWPESGPDLALMWHRLYRTTPGLSGPVTHFLCTL